MGSLAAAGFAVGGGAAGAALVQRSGSTAGPDPTEIDIGFLTDMSLHHGQALVMCQRVLGTDTGPDVQAAAAEVLQNKAIELGMMRAWLADWGQSTAPPELVMGWMTAEENIAMICFVDQDERDTAMRLLAENSDGIPPELMPGVASTAELDDLSTLTGTERGRRWLELMSAHHEGGVHMAEAAAAYATSEKVVRLASTQAAAQSYEIGVYADLLSTAYAV